MLLLVLLFLYPQVSRSQTTSSSGCPCDGTKLTLSGQVHCFEIIHGSGESWVSGDEKCASHGGYLAHLNSANLISQLKTYISANYQKPLMIGATVGNVNTGLVALMCPSNQFSSIVNTSVLSSLFVGNASTVDRCVFLEKSDFKLHYLACDTDADILCDFPMTSASDVCNAQMNCTTTTSSTTTFSTTTPLTTSSTRTSTSTILTSSTAKASTSKTTKAPIVGGGSALNGTTTRAVTSSAAASTTKKASSSTTTTMTTHNGTSPVTAVATSTSPKVNTSSTSTTKTSTTPSNSSPTPSTTKLANATTLQTTISVGSTKRNISSTSSTTRLPGLNATTNRPYGSTSTTNSPNSCDRSGYTRVFGWCVPWWCWLLFGLLLLLLLLCCLGWLLHFCCKLCLCWLPKEQVSVESARQWERNDSSQQTDEIYIPPSTTPAITVSPAPSPVPTEVHHHHHHKTEIINNNNNNSTPVAPPAAPSVIYDITVYKNNFNFRKDGNGPPPVPVQPLGTALMLLPPTDDDILSTASMSIGLPEVTPLHSPTDVLPMGDKAARHDGRVKPPMQRNDLNNSFESKGNLPNKGSGKGPSNGFPPLNTEEPILPQKPKKAEPIELPRDSSPARSPFEVPNDEDNSIEPPTYNNNEDANTPPLFSTNKPPGSGNNNPPKKSKPSDNPTTRSFPEPPFSRNSPQRKADRRPNAGPTGGGGAQQSPKVANPNMAPLRQFPAPSAPQSQPNNGAGRTPVSPKSNGTNPPSANANKAPMMNSPSGRRTPKQSPPSENGDNREKPNVNPREARGKLGGVAGKAGAPEGWKPWARSAQPFTDHPGFLGND